MSFSEKLKKILKNEDLLRVMKYMRKPAVITFIIAGIIVALTIFALFASQMLEPLIVSLNIRYNSPAFIAIAIVFLAVQIGALFFGILISLRKYKRPSGKMFSSSYNKGNSYRALNNVLKRDNLIK